MADLSRRDFFQSAALLAAGATVPALGDDKRAGGNPRGGPVVVSSGNGLRSTERAAKMILQGADTLDAAIAGVNIVEEDPEDNSVGYGGLPNEDGIVELDSSVMHGPTCRAGAVAALRNIKTPSQVARLVMQRTDHVLLVGDGALKFARAHGFKEEDLLTEKSRQIWLKWKESHSDHDDWLSPEEESAGGRRGDAAKQWPVTYGTITCLALNMAGDVSGVTTTSGLSFKLAGRVGDSPIFGAGLFVDQQVGAAGSTGRGEAVLKVCGAHTVVEAMRQGMAPTDACIQALRRILQTTKEKRLLDDQGRPNFDVKFYALSKDGRFGAASIWGGGSFAVFADGRNRLETCESLFQRQG